MAQEEYPVNIPVKVTGAEQAEQQLKKVSQAGTDAEKSATGLGSKVERLGGIFDEVSGASNDLAGSLRGLATGSVAGVGALTALAGAAVAAGSAFLINAKNMIDNADATEEMAARMGISIDRLLALKLVAEENGGSLEGLQRSFDKISMSVQEVNKGSAETINAFRRLGIAEKDLANMSQEQIAGTVIRNMRELGESAETVSAAQKILGEGFRQNAASIVEAADNIEEYNRRVEYFGAKPSQELLDAAGKQERAFGDLDMAVDGLRNTFAEMSNGVVGDLVQMTANGIGELNKMLKALNEFWAFGSQNNPAWLDKLIFLMPGLGSIAAKTGQALGAKINPPTPMEQSAAETARLSRGAPPPMSTVKPIEQIITGGKKPSAGPKSDPFANMIASLEKQAAMVRATTELEKIQYENQNGASKNFTEAQKQRLENAAREVDIQRTIEQMRKSELKMTEDQRKEEERKTQELEKQLQRQNEIAQRGIAEIGTIGNNALSGAQGLFATVGMGASQRETFKLLEENANKAKEEIAALDKNLSGYQERVDAINAAEAASAEKIRASAELRKQYTEDWTNGAKNAIGNYLEYVNDSAARMEEIWGKGMKGMEDALVDFATTGKLSFKDLISSILQDIIRFIIQKTVMAPIVAGLKSIFGFANGGIFEGGAQVQAFADGGVVSGPTLFPMEGGKTGLMGEAGPEAIMPLKRTASGALGVQVAGGSMSSGGVQIGSISVVVQGGNTNQETGDAVTAGMIRAFERIADGRIANAKRLGNMLNPI